MALRWQSCSSLSKQQEGAGRSGSDLPRVTFQGKSAPPQTKDLNLIRHFESPQTEPGRCAPRQGNIPKTKPQIGILLCHVV